MSESTARGIAGLANFRFANEDEIARGIDRTMREVVRVDAKYNPQAHGPISNTTPAGAAVAINGPTIDPRAPFVPGFRLDVPKETPGGKGTQDLIGKICDAKLGPAVPVEGRIASLSLATVEELIVLVAKQLPTKATAALGDMLERQKAQLMRELAKEKP